MASKLWGVVFSRKQCALQIFWKWKAQGGGTCLFLIPDYPGTSGCGIR